MQNRWQAYIFFSEHLLVEASHMPPAFSQSAALVAVVTSPAKAGPVKASAKANANMETSIFMTFSPLACTRGAGENAAWRRLFRGPGRGRREAGQSRRGPSVGRLPPEAEAPRKMSVERPLMFGIAFFSMLRTSNRLEES